MEQLELLLSRDTTTFLSTLSLYRLRMKKDKNPVSFIEMQNEELFIYPLIGSVLINDAKYLVGRKSVKQPPRSAFQVYCPNIHHEISITLKSETADILVVSRSNINDHHSGDSVYQMMIDSFTPHSVGRGTHKRTVFVPKDPPPPFQIYGGETLNIDGGWSSWPAHASGDDLGNWSQWQEVFFVITPGYGILSLDGVYHDGTRVNGTQIVKNGDAIVTPLGSHPIVASPGSWLWYAWFYTGDALKKTYNQWATDLGTYVK